MESQRRKMQATSQNLASKPQPCGNTQMNGNGLIVDVRANTLKLLAKEYSY